MNGVPRLWKLAENADGLGLLWVLVSGPASQEAPGDAGQPDLAQIATRSASPGGEVMVPTSPSFHPNPAMVPTSPSTQT